MPRYSFDSAYLGSTKVWDSRPPLLCFTANNAGSTINMTKVGSPTDRSLETSTDGNTWTAYTFGTDITLTNVGDKVYWRSANDTDTGLSTSTSNYYKFVMSGSIKGSGDITYLLNKNGGVSTIPNNYCFYRLFTGCPSLTQSPELPATTLANYCYYYMFNGCSSLTQAPVLPATTLTSYCYQYMFSGCSSLTQAPVLPATTLSNYCYSYMFQNCTGLTSVPKLPATTLGTYCYQYMFSGCSNLETLPTLPATTMKNYCYRNMFYNCSKIKISSTQTGEYTNEFRIPTTGTGTTATSWASNMFAGTGGTFTSGPTINTTYYTSNTVV